MDELLDFLGRCRFIHGPTRWTAIIVADIPHYRELKRKGLVESYAGTRAVRLTEKGWKRWESEFSARMKEES